MISAWWLCLIIPASMFFGVVLSCCVLAWSYVSDEPEPANFSRLDEDWMGI